MKPMSIMSINFFWKELKYGGHLQCLSAVSIVLISSFLLGINISWSGLAVIYLIFYPVYLFDRFKGVKEDYLTNRKRTAYIKGYYNFIPFVIIIDVIAVLILAGVYSGFETSLLALIFILSGFAYQSRLKKITKKVYLFKNIFVALFFVAIIGFYFFYCSVDVKNIIPMFYILAPLFFLKVLFMQIFFDLKDEAADKKTGLLTLPAVAGKEKTLAFLKTGNLLLTVAIIIFYMAGLLPFPILILIPAVAYTFFYLRKSRADVELSYIFSASELILWFLLIITVNFIYGRF